MLAVSQEQNVSIESIYELMYHINNSSNQLSEMIEQSNTP